MDPSRHSGVSVMSGSATETDHNLNYATAIALLDRQVLPEQFTSQRINRADVPTLL